MQPPLEKDPAFLASCVDEMPKGINLFWAPGLYVPESEFEKWVNAFGKEHIWARDTEGELNHVHDGAALPNLRFESDPV